MLQQVRSALKGVVAWFVIVLLVLAFALWGVPELRNFAQGSPLRVGKVDFSSQAILNEFNRQMTARRNETGGAFTREDAIAAGLPDAVISTLASRSVLEQEARKLGLVMPRAIVRDYLHTDERFQNPATGRFDQFALESILSANGFTPSQFEDALKRDLLRTELIQSVAAGGLAPRPMAEALLLREVERRRIAYLTVTEDMAGAPEEPTPEALRAYYQENAAAFTAPEYRRFTAVILREADFREGLEAPEEDLRRFYEANKSRLYDIPEKRTLYQATFDSEAEAQAAASALRQGRPFEEIAAQRGLSLDAATFADITRGDLLDPKVAEAAFDPVLEPGDVADPVQGFFGWTVIQVVGVTAPETKTFEDVREELESQYFAQDSRRRMFEAIEAIEEARDTGANLVQAAENAGVDARRFGPVDSSGRTPDGEAVADLPAKILAEAFRLEEADETSAIELADKDGYFFIHVDDVTPPALRPYEEVAEAVEARWRREEARARIEAVVAEIRQTVADGSSLEEAAAPYNRSPIVEVIDRSIRNETFSPALVEDIFFANLGALVSGPAGYGQAYVTAEIREIDFARNRVGPGEEIGFRQFIGYQLDQELLDAYITSLREDYGVRIDQNAVANLFSDSY